MTDRLITHLRHVDLAVPDHDKQLHLRPDPPVSSLTADCRGRPRHCRDTAAERKYMPPANPPTDPAAQLECVSLSAGDAL